MENKKEQKFYHKWWFWVIVAFVVLAIAGNNKTPGQIKKTSLPVREVTLLELQDAYSANEVSADAEYGKQTLQTSGEVVGINQGAGDRPFLSIKGPRNPLLGLQCVFKNRASDIAPLSNITKGQTVTVQGKVFDYRLGNVIFDNCQVIEIAE